MSNETEQNQEKIVICEFTSILQLRIRQMFWFYC